MRKALTAKETSLKDARVLFYRKTLEGLLESLDATVRVMRWNQTESVPEPLRDSASQLVTRLGTVHRLTTSAFRGSPADSARVERMVEAMKKLDAAYVVYHELKGRSPAEGETAATALGSEVEEVTADDRWRS